VTKEEGSEAKLHAATPKEKLETDTQHQITRFNFWKKSTAAISVSMVRV
jgi:hypothetical protein